MATYVVLLQWTQKGIENLKGSPSRLDHAKEAFRAAGGNLKQFFLTMGTYDMVVIGEAPDDQTCARIMLALASSGGIRSQTMRAFSEAEYREIIAGLP